MENKKTIQAHKDERKFKNPHITIIKKYITLKERGTKKKNSDKRRKKLRIQKRDREETQLRKQKRR